MFRKLISFLTTATCIILIGIGGAGFVSTSQVYAASSPALFQPSVTAALPTSISGGFGHNCILFDDGSVKCWGSNRYGQLGNPVLTLHPFPTAVVNLGGAASAIGAGAYHTCALMSDKTVKCWGLNSSGQLGNGTTTNNAAPTAVAGISNVIQVASGYAYSCALISGGSVKCWGDNNYGQLGVAPGTAPVTSPVTVSGVSGAVAISASLDHTCALLSGQTAITCWGKNSYGQLGNGSTAPTSTPVTVSMPALGGATILSVSAGAQHTCALLSTGQVYCWGDGILGQVGGGINQTQNLSPVLVSNLTNASAISAGGYADSGHTCALTSAGGVVCWGSNAYGQLGDGSNANRNVPVGVSGLGSGVLSVQVGVNQSCALMGDHSVRCWGADGSGQLGDGVVSISTKAISSGGFSGGVTQVGTGDRSTCAVVSGKVWCWGNNKDGQLGDGTQVNRPAPVAVNGLSGTISAIDAGMHEGCAVVNGGVQCWGNLNPATNTIQPPTSIAGVTSGVTSLSVTNLLGCAVTNGAARCWGDNTYGQLGDGSSTASYTSSVSVSGLASGVAQVSTGQWFACALKTNQTVWCWGKNTAGEIGSDPTTRPTSSTPLQVPGLSGITAIAAGQDHVCAINQSGGVVCWGNNGQGQLGNGNQVDTFTPIPVSGLASGVSQITAGGYHTCALVNGGVQCWGFNSFGQLGNGLMTLSKIPVVPTDLASGISAVVAGGINYDQEQSCAITTQGRLRCWGGNEYGQLGDNLPIQRSQPVRVLGLTGGPEVGFNYMSGKLGSTFRVAAVNFPANSPLPIKINGKQVGAASTNADGNAIFHIKVNQNLASALPVSVSNLSTNLNITSINSPSGAVNLQEGSGQVFFDNASLYYLPAINR